MTDAPPDDRQPDAERGQDQRRVPTWLVGRLEAHRNRREQRQVDRAQLDHRRQHGLEARKRVKLGRLRRDREAG